MLQDKLKPWEVTHLTKKFDNKQKKRKFLRKMSVQFRHPHSVFHHHPTFPWKTTSNFFYNRYTLGQIADKENRQNFMHLYRLGRFDEDEIVANDFNEDAINGEPQNFGEMLEFYLPVTECSPLLDDFEFKCNEAV